MGYISRIQHRRGRVVAGHLTTLELHAYVLKEILYTKAISRQTLA